MRNENAPVRFSHIKGRTRPVTLEHIRNFPGASVQEGEVELVRGAFLNTSKSFILKTVNPERRRSTRPDDDVSVSPIEQQQKWFDLKEAGVTVVPTFRINERANAILETDLTRDGKDEVFDPAAYLKTHNYYSRPPEWYLLHKDALHTDVITNAIRAASVQYLISFDATFFVYDQQTDIARAFVGDIGRGVVKKENQTADILTRLSLATYFHYMEDGRLSDVGERERALRPFNLDNIE